MALLGTSSYRCLEIGCHFRFIIFGYASNLLFDVGGRFPIVMLSHVECKVLRKSLGVHKTIYALSRATTYIPRNSHSPQHERLSMGHPEDAPSKVSPVEMADPPNIFALLRGRWPQQTFENFSRLSIFHPTPPRGSPPWTD